MSTAELQSISESEVSQVPCQDLCDVGTRKRARNKEIPPLSEDDIQRFWSYVDRRGPDECWPWTGGTCHASPYSPQIRYGIFRIRKVMFKAHRVAYVIQNGQFPASLTIDHCLRLGCTNSLCMNGAHLEPATQTEQVARRRRHGPKPGTVYRKRKPRTSRRSNPAVTSGPRMAL